MREVWAVKPGSKVDVSSIDPADTRALKGGRSAAVASLESDRQALAEWQTRLWAENRRALLLILQGTDASGKDGTVAHVFSGVNPQGTSVTAFKPPTAEELAHDFLWRVHASVPHAGQIGIFNRSQYEDVLVARVRKLVPKPVWKKRYDDITAFEQLLTQGGTTIIKCCLLISKDEQRRRFEERLRDPRNAGSSSAATSRIARCGRNIRLPIRRRSRAPRAGTRRGISSPRITSGFATGW